MKDDKYTVRTSIPEAILVATVCVLVFLGAVYLLLLPYIGGHLSEKKENSAVTGITEMVENSSENTEVSESEESEESEATENAEETESTETTESAEAQSVSDDNNNEER